MKSCFVFALLALAAFAAVSGNNPANTSVWEDSLRIVGTGSDTTCVIWVDKLAEKVLLIEGNDSTSAGFASDSASVDVRVMQVWPITAKGTNNYFVVLNSHANPDSTSGNGSSSWKIFTALSVPTMDTANVFVRNRVSVDQRSIPGDSILAKSTLSNFGAFAYARISPDASPAIAFILTGTAGNKKAAAGSKWRLRLSGVTGSPVRGN